MTMIKKIFIQNYKIFYRFDLELNSDLNKKDLTEDMLSMS